MIVAIDTASAFTTMAIVDSGEVIAFDAHEDPRKHAEVAAPMLRRLLVDSGVLGPNVEAVACGVGPGPYTGLRVGIATARALGLAWDVPVVGLCSLDAVAEQVLAGEGDPGEFSVAVDARRGEVYWARYDAGGDRTEGPLVGRWEDLADSTVRWIGPGGIHPDAGWVARRVERLIRAGEVVREFSLDLDQHGTDGSTTAAAITGMRLLPPAPLYLRRPDAQEQKRPESREQKR